MKHPFLLIVSIVIIVVIGYFSYTKIGYFFKIDSCLDKGGQWNYKTNKCQVVDSSYSNAFNKNRLKISERGVVIYRPDSVKIKNAKMKNEDEFYVAADDAMFYINEVRTFLEKQSVKIVNTELRYIDYFVDGKIIKSYNLNADEFYWGVILFNGTDLPEEVDMTDFETYFSKIMK